MTCNEKKNQSIETDLEMTQMMKLINKSTKIIATREGLILRKPEERLTTFGEGVKDIKRDPDNSLVLMTKSTMSLI